MAALFPSLAKRQKPADLNRTPMILGQGPEIAFGMQERRQPRTPGIFRHEDLFYGEESLSKPPGERVALTAEEVARRRTAHGAEEKTAGRVLTGRRGRRRRKRLLGRG